MIDICVVTFLFSLAIVKKYKQRPEGFRAGLSLVLRTFSTCATTGTLAWLSYDCIEMRKVMEGNSAWYRVDPSTNQFSYMNVVTWALFASSIITIGNAFAEVYKKDPRDVSNTAVDDLAEEITALPDKFNWEGKTSAPPDISDLS
ncbi:hypothetical protein K432DRAFT_402466 [Lepidopterella palustris CBS 459.81]|uniref:Uncharacterized protein n=1 Tax=Lepidopterella palustris CBS 459.81 TaxID=1314670 RepID=A0A8E2JHW9_9PEZI|nr:hypothetical protein K432DRAFT_402466 [Lepidopterella palustris CBS 459.81]